MHVSSGLGSNGVFDLHFMKKKVLVYIFKCGYLAALGIARFNIMHGFDPFLLRKVTDMNPIFRDRAERGLEMERRYG